jgi:hypothetical protein
MKNEDARNTSIYLILHESLKNRHNWFGLDGEILPHIPMKLE